MKKGFWRGSRQQANASRPDRRIAFRIFAKDSAGSAKNITPNREASRSKFSGANGWMVASARANSTGAPTGVTSRARTSIGAVVQTPAMGDRFVSSFAVETSTDGISFTPWGALSVDGSTVDPLSIAGLGDVRFIRYAFGPSGDFFGEGGSAVYQVEAVGVPEPATWAMMLVGFGGLGVAMRSRRKLATAAA